MVRLQIFSAKECRCGFSFAHLKFARSVLLPRVLLNSEGPRSVSTPEDMTHLVGRLFLDLGFFVVKMQIFP